MNLSKLALLSTDALTVMQSAIKDILASRLDTTLRIGRIGRFPYDGTHRTIMIERINGKTVSGREIGTSAKPGSKWRVSKSVVEIVGEERKVPLPTKPLAEHKPAQGGDW